MNKLYDEMHKNVLMGHSAVLTSTLNMLEHSRTNNSHTWKQHRLNELEDAYRDKIRITTQSTPVSTTTPSSYLASVHLLFPGEAGVSQAEQEDVVSRLISGLPEAVHISGANQSAGAPETPQRPLSHQNSGQQQRVQVGIICHLMCASVCGFGMDVSCSGLKSSVFVCGWKAGSFPFWPGTWIYRQNNEKVTCDLNWSTLYSIPVGVRSTRVLF